MVRSNLDLQGDESDVLTHDGVRFRNQVRVHMNFWARIRSSNKIKRFFAEIRYQPPPRPDASVIKLCATVVESCCIIGTYNLLSFFTYLYKYLHV